MVGVQGNERNYIKGAPTLRNVENHSVAKRNRVALGLQEDWILRRVRFLMFRPDALVPRLH